MKLWRQDKGHGAEMQALADALEQGTPTPTPFEEIAEVMCVTLKSGQKKHRPL